MRFEAIVLFVVAALAALIAIGVFLIGPEGHGSAIATVTALVSVVAGFSGWRLWRNRSR